MSKDSPDIICVSETHLPLHEIIDVPGYRFYGKNRASQKPSGGVAILIRNDKFQEYTVETCCNDTEGIIGVKLEHKRTRYSTIVVSNYLSPSNSKYGKNPEQFYNRLLMLAYEQCNSNLLIYAGDFNARIGHIQDTPFEHEVPIRQCVDKTVNSHGQNLLNFLSDSCMCVINGRGNDPEFTCTTPTRNSVIDYVIVPYEDLTKITEFTVTPTNEIIHDKGLGHLITAGSAPPDQNLIQIKFKSTGHYVEDFVKGLGIQNVKRKTVPRKFKSDYMTNERIKTVINTMIEQIDTAVQTQSEINEIYSTLTESIIAEMENYKKGTRRKNTPHKAYWTQELTDLWADVQEKFNLARNILKGASKRQLLRLKTNNRCVMEYRIAVQRFDRELKIARRRFSVEKIAQIDSLIRYKNPKVFWEEVEKLGPRKKRNFVCEATDEWGNVTRNPSTVKQHWFDEFSRLYVDQPTGDFDDDFYMEKMIELEEFNTDDNSCVELNSEITINEVRNSIMGGKARKACGCDLIPYEAIKNGPCISALHKLFVICFKTGLIPSEWRKSEIVPIPKGKKSISTKPLTYRGLGLQSCLYKAYSYILNKRLTNYLETNGLINDTQNGFRKDRSCVDHVFTLAETIKLNTGRPESRVFACFIDMRRAFDKIDRNLLLTRLHELGVTGSMHAAFSAIYHSPICRIRLTDDVTDWMNSNYGTIQGDIISPKLFSVQINNLIKQLNDGKSGLFYGGKETDRFACLAFADDIVLVASTEAELQNLVNKVRNYCRKWRMTVNADKTKTMVFKKNYHSRRDEIQIRYGDKILEQVRQYKYLGVMLDETLRFNTAQEELASAGGRALGALINKTKAHKDMGYKTFTKLYDCCVSPVMEYCSEVTGHSTIKKIQDVQFRACRYFLGLPRTTALVTLNSEMGWLPVEYKRHKNVIRYYNRLMRMDNSRIPKQVFLSTRSNTNSWAQETLKILQKYNIAHYWDLNSAVPSELMEFNIKDTYKSEWYAELNEKPKLRLYRHIKTSMTASVYVKAGVPKHERSLISQLLCGSLRIRLETSRYDNEPLFDRICETCNSGEVENESHLVFDCIAYKNLRDQLYEKVGDCNFRGLFNRSFVFGAFLKEIWKIRNAAGNVS